MMCFSLQQFEIWVSKTMGIPIRNLRQDPDCEEYCGYSFQLGLWNIKFRRAKITPKKVGQFVTLWKRNSEGKTVPFHEDDNFDFYVIAVDDEEKRAYFIFPQKILIEKQIVSTGNKEGKRGFRIYPVGTKTESKQAILTQSWQSKYFTDLTISSSADKILEIMKI
jgi:hypothetical protein